VGVAGNKVTFELSETTRQLPAPAGSDGPGPVGTFRVALELDYGSASFRHFMRRKKKG
jgi:hypothetical protein